MVVRERRIRASAAAEQEAGLDLVRRVVLFDARGPRRTLQCLSAGCRRQIWVEWLDWPRRRVVGLGPRLLC